MAQCRACTGQGGWWGDDPDFDGVSRMSQESKWSEVLQLFKRLFLPEQKKWIVRVLIFAGIGIVSGVPIWVPILNAFLEKYGEFKFTEPDPLAGWVLLAVALIIFAIFEVVERLPKAKTVSAEDVADRKTLDKLFSRVDLRPLNKFFQHGKGTMIYFPAVHYCEELGHLVSAAQFHLHDSHIYSAVTGLQEALGQALEQIDYFGQASNEDLLKFESRRDIHVDPDARHARDSFLSAVRAGEENLRNLCRLVRAKYPDFDYEATSQIADDSLQRRLRRTDQERAAAVSNFEVAMLGEILRLEEIKATPNLYNLTTGMQCENLEGRVTLDRLIERGFVKHLYPGWSHQKYTVLSAGRAYYLSNRNSG